MKLLGHSKRLGLCVDNLGFVAHSCSTNSRLFGGQLTTCDSPLCCGQTAARLSGLKTARPRGLSTCYDPPKPSPPKLSRSHRQSSHQVYTWASRFTSVHPLISSWRDMAEQTQLLWLQCSLSKVKIQLTTLFVNQFKSIIGPCRHLPF